MYLTNNVIFVLQRRAVFVLVSTHFRFSDTLTRTFDGNVVVKSVWQEVESLLSVCEPRCPVQPSFLGVWFLGLVKEEMCCMGQYHLERIATF